MEDTKRAVASELLIRMEGGDIVTEKNTGIIKLCKLVRGKKNTAVSTFDMHLARGRSKNTAQSFRLIWHSS